MKNQSILLASIIATSISGSSIAAVIDNSVITDLIDQTTSPGYTTTRLLGTTISGDSAVYLVGTMNFDPENLGGSFVEANMGGTSGAINGFIAGFGNGFGTQTIVIARNGTRLSTTETFTVGTPVQLVMKFNQLNGETTLWVNPNLGTTEALNPFSGRVTVSEVQNSNFSSVVFRGGDFTAPNSIVDYSNFSVYYGGSTPFIPEPSSIALLALGGLAAARRRR